MATTTTEWSSAEHVHQHGVAVAFAVHDHAFQVHQPVLDVMVKHHDGEEVVGAAPEVRIQDYRDGLPQLVVVAVGDVVLRAAGGEGQRKEKEDNCQFFHMLSEFSPKDTKKTDNPEGYSGIS